jgi:hypothetical protein
MLKRENLGGSLQSCQVAFGCHLHCVRHLGFARQVAFGSHAVVIWATPVRRWSYALCASGSRWSRCWLLIAGYWFKRFVISKEVRLRNLPGKRLPVKNGALFSWVLPGRFLVAMPEAKLPSK